MQHTRSPRAVKARKQYAELRARQQAGQLSAEEDRRIQKLIPFVDPED
jgi:hypothetical protein